MYSTKRKPSYIGLIIVVSLLAVFMSILLTAIGILLFGNRAKQLKNNAPIAETPMTLLMVESIDPALALVSLGGVSEGQIIAESIKKSRTETALAGLLFYPSLSDKESAGDFLLLGGAFANTPNKNKAVFSYQKACLIATLSPDIPDIVRADILLQASEGLIAINQPTLAKFYLEQAFTIASGSPLFQAAQRRTIFERLQKNYLMLNERQLARQSLDLSANPPSLTPLTQTVSLLLSNQPVSLSQPVQEAESNRWIKAQQLAALLVDRGGNAPAESYNALREALLNEDSQKLPFYENQLSTATQVSQKINITVAQIEWLSTKYRVAKRGYGVSLVPAWEADTDQIQADLGKSYQHLFNLYADLIVALPEISQIDKATEEKLRREILVGELGWYPNYPQKLKQQQLLASSTKLMTTQPEVNIFISTKLVADKEVYILGIRN